MNKKERFLATDGHRLTQIMKIEKTKNLRKLFFSAFFYCVYL